jgi:hypothetical protein
MLLIRLAWFCVTDYGFIWCSAANGPKLDPNSDKVLKPALFTRVLFSLSPVTPEAAPGCRIALEAN